ncbi:MAG: PD40 domain-containing protein [Anaerolineae bacterium]|nr:PD40 domain-containing protein [Anaerolineae bacterium]
MNLKPYAGLLPAILMSMMVSACIPVSPQPRQPMSTQSNAQAVIPISSSPTPAPDKDLSDIALPLSYSGILPEGAVAMLGVGRISTSVSPDGRYFAVWSDKEAQVYDFATLEPMWNQARPGGEVTWLLGGEQIAIGRYIWDIQTGRRTLATTLALPPTSKWSPKGFIIATPGSDSSILLLEAHTGLEIHRLELPESLRAALPPDVPGYNQITISFSPDAQLVAATYAWTISDSHKGDGETLAIWNVKTGEMLRTLSPAKGDGQGRTTIAWSPDSKWLATTSFGDLYLWDVETGDVLKDFTGAQYITWSPDGSMFATSVNATHEGGELVAPVRVWDSATLEEKYTLQEAEEAILWSPDSARFVTTSSIVSTRSVVREAATGKELCSISNSERLVGFDAGSNQVIGHLYYTYDPSDHNTLVVWNIDGAMARQAAVYQGTSSIIDIAWSPDGKSIAGAMGWWEVPGVAVWDIASSAARTLLGMEELGLESHVNLTTIDWMPGSSTLAISSETSGGLFIDTRDLSVESSPALSGFLTYSPDGAMLASAHDRQVDVLLTSSGEKIHTVTLDKVIPSALRWSPDGTKIAVATIPEDAIWYTGYDREHPEAKSPSGEVLVWDVQSNEMVATLKGILGLPYSVAWSPNGREIVAGFNVDTLGIWNVADGKLVRWLYGNIEEYGEEYHEMGYVDVDWSPDGIYIAAAYGKNPFFRECKACYFGVPGKVILWDAAVGSRVSRYATHTDEVQTIAFSPDSLSLASGSLDGTIIVWDVTARPIEKPEDAGSDTPDG